MKKKNNNSAVIVMAYTSCAASLAANIAPDCAHPLVSGFTGRAILINWADAPTLTYSGNNPRIITAITLGSGVKVSVVDNVSFQNPLNGTQEQSSADNGPVKFTKTPVVNIPKRGAGTSKDIVEALVRAPLGFLMIAEKQDKVGDGSFVVFGAEQGLKANPDGIVRNEYENGGSVVATLSCIENYFEYTFFDTDYATTLAAFETLMASAY